ITVLGEARGNWYFEASFPVRVLDANGKELGRGIAQAEGEWMTTNFVPFRATVRFSPPTTETGTVVFQKDNPSGLPEHDAEVKVPVRFSQVVSQTRDIKLYFYNDQLDRDSSGNVLCSAAGLVAVDRSIPFTNTPIQDAVRQLLQGPDSVERLTLSGTEFPLPGVSLTGASLSNGVLTLSFNDLQNRTSGGSCRVNILRAQIEATARQFGGVNEVRLLPTTAFQP
ncbi:MAG: Gmad2 immunoglobulin-like domain-containing protein, partial [Parcubacteria group bacterium]